MDLVGDIVRTLAYECRKQCENCAYTAVSFTIWLRCLRLVWLASVVAPVVFGALAVWKLLAETAPGLGAVFALLATVIPPSYRAAKGDEAIKNCKRMAGEFTNLRDEFERAATVWSLKPFPEFEKEATKLFDRMDKARGVGLTPPEFCFLLARRKLNKGHYSHDGVPGPKD
jgi:hypothetical protein